MKFFFTAIVLVLDFVISWTNARYVGRYWSESKEVGGSFRTYIVSGYAMAIAGFTMVYGYLLLLISPVFLQMANADPETILAFRQLTADMIYFLCVAAVIPSGFFIWIRSLKDAWEQRTLSSGLTAGWNSYAQLRNTVDAARNAPSALRRIIKALFGGKGKKKGDAIVALCAILVVIIALFGGYFTASAIMKKADREYDLFAELEEQNPEYF